MPKPLAPPAGLPARREAVATILRAALLATFAVLPAFLLGTMAVQVRNDLDMGPAELGVAAATLFAVTGLLARPFGLWVQQIGVRLGMTISALLAAVSLAGVGLAGSFFPLVAALSIGGVANAMAQPSANMSISDAIGPRRLGLAFGIKQASIPAATLLGALAVPGIALTIGWRWAFLASAVAAVGMAAWSIAGHRQIKVQKEAIDPEADRGIPRKSLVLVTIGAGLGAGAATALGVFFIDSAVQSGMEATEAGLVFATSSLLGLVIRVGLGMAMDRYSRRSPYVLVANLLVGGAFGYLLLAFDGPGFFMAGALLAYGAGWTWPGLIHFAVVRDNRSTVASATGILQTGLSLGAATGPLLFGLMVETTSYRATWLAAGGVALIAAVTFRAGIRLIRRAYRTTEANIRQSRVAGDQSKGRGKLSTE